MIKAEDLIGKFKEALADHFGYIWGTAGVAWTQAKQTQKINYMKSKYGNDWQKNADAKNDNYYMAAMYGSKWIGHTVADCSGMFVWAFKQYGIAMSHISTTIYTKYCDKKGSLTDALKKTILPGTAVFTGSKATNHPHVGLYVGSGKVIEAHGTQAGVCTSNITEKRWTWYGQLNDVEYPAQEAQEQPSDGKDGQEPTQTLPTLKKGMKGEYVKLLQTKLVNKGYSVGSYGIDGDFGSATLRAVQQFQRDNGLDPDGVVGTRTWAALNDQTVKITYYSVTVSHLTESQAKSLAGMYDHATIEKEVG